MFVNKTNLRISTYVHTYTKTAATLATIAGSDGNTNLVLLTYIVTCLHCDFSTATSSKNETVHKQTESPISALIKNVTEA